MAEKSRTIIIVHETTLKSWLSDAGTLAMFLALIGVGWAVDSTAMQWTGAFVGFIHVATSGKRRQWTYTIDEARKKLNEIEAETVGEIA